MSQLCCSWHKVQMKLFTPVEAVRLLNFIHQKYAPVQGK